MFLTRRIRRYRICRCCRQIIWHLFISLINGTIYHYRTVLSLLAIDKPSLFDVSGFGILAHSRKLVVHTVGFSEHLHDMCMLLSPL